jgi:hypothetical protein
VQDRRGSSAHDHHLREKFLSVKSKKKSESQKVLRKLSEIREFLKNNSLPSLDRASGGLTQSFPLRVKFRRQPAAAWPAGRADPCVPTGNRRPAGRPGPGPAGAGASRGRGRQLGDRPALLLVPAAAGKIPTDDGGRTAASARKRTAARARKRTAAHACRTQTAAWTTAALVTTDGRSRRHPNRFAAHGRARGGRPRHFSMCARTHTDGASAPARWAGWPRETPTETGRSESRACR